jgi:hypothetical protein
MMTELVAFLADALLSGPTAVVAGDVPAPPSQVAAAAPVMGSGGGPVVPSAPPLTPALAAAPVREGIAPLPPMLTWPLQLGPWMTCVQTELDAVMVRAASVLAGGSAPLLSLLPTLPYFALSADGAWRILARARAPASCSSASVR